MLDPFSAVSLAGTIVQFVHFGAELLSKIKDVHRSGSTVDCQELDTLACHLKELSKRVKGHDLQGSPQTTLPKNEEVDLPYNPLSIWQEADRITFRNCTKSRVAARLSQISLPGL